jgi:hypothetical protein
MGEMKNPKVPEGENPNKKKILNSDNIVNKAIKANRERLA